MGRASASFRTPPLAGLYVPDSHLIRRFRTWSAIGRGLDAVELGVGPALRHQRLVGADLGYAGAVEDDDEVGHAHRAEPVRDEDRDALGPLGRRRVALEQRVFGLGVQAAV